MKRQIHAETLSFSDTTKSILKLYNLLPNSVDFEYFELHYNVDEWQNNFSIQRYLQISTSNQNLSILPFI